MKNKKYLLICSNLQIPFDEDELLDIYKALDSGSKIFLRQGSFNPSFYVGIQQDEKKMHRLYEDLKYEIRDKGLKEFPKYDDIFAGLREQIKNLELGSGNNKQLP